MLSRFFLHPVKNNAKSAEQGHPVFDDVLYIELINPGAIDSQMQRKASERDKVQYAEAYARFQAGRGDEITGWRIDQWPALTPAEVEQLRALKFYTVESIAEASDTQIKSVMGGTSLRERAKAAVAQAANSAEAERLAAELQKRDAIIASLEQRMQGLERELNASRQSDDGDGVAKRGPGRPRKYAEAA